MLLLSVLNVVVHVVRRTRVDDDFVVEQTTPVEVVESSMDLHLVLVALLLLCL